MGEDGADTPRVLNILHIIAQYFMSLTCDFMSKIYLVMSCEAVGGETLQIHGSDSF